MFTYITLLSINYIKNIAKSNTSYVGGFKIHRNWFERSWAKWSTKIIKAQDYKDIGFNVEKLEKWE